jgi:hypothetical protein
MSWTKQQEFEYLELRKRLDELSGARLEARACLAAVLNEGLLKRDEYEICGVDLDKAIEKAKQIRDALELFDDGMRDAEAR